MSDHHEYQSACELLKKLICDRMPDQPLPEDLDSIPELNEIHSMISQIRNAIIALSNGDLDYTITHKGFLPGSLKALQASLKHLTWQTQSIAAGDFTQRVDFMGEFSDSFNKMTETLDSTVSELHASREQYKLLTEFASDVIWVLQVDQERYSYISPSVFRLRGFTPDEVKAQRVEDVVAEEHIEAFKALVKSKLDLFVTSKGLHEHFLYEIQQKRKDGSLVWTEASVRFRYNEANEIELIGVTRNIEKRKEAEQAVKYLSYHDQLTGLYNRRFYEEELKHIDVEENLPLSIIMADVNGLKLTNDAFGHGEGDRLLQAISKILKEGCRNSDILARLGGDEFVILMPKTSRDRAQAIVSSLEDKLEHAEAGKTILSVSFGLATKTRVEENLESVYTAADDEMYKHKLSSSIDMKNRVIGMTIENLFANDPFVMKHSIRVQQLCKTIGSSMKLSTKALHTLELAGRFHDIGKVGVDSLDDADFKRHPEIGYQILKSSTDYVSVADCVLCHHEHLDGSGYPRGIDHTQLSKEARILAVVEAYDNLVYKRVEDQGISSVDAIEVLKSEYAHQFDSDVVKVLESIIIV